MKERLMHDFQLIRNKSEDLCQALAIEDYVIQGMEDVSPPKWHLAHTTWFFETFILQNKLIDYDPFNASFQHLFNSYYQGVSTPFPRAKRGLLSRPTVQHIYEYRKHVDNQILNLLDTHYSEDLHTLITLGLEHEQQHQELLLMDIKYNFSLYPDRPAYQQPRPTEHNTSHPLQFIAVPGGIATIGYTGKEFCFDNELPLHKIIIPPFSIADRLVTNQEYQEFIQDEGYKNPSLWLADGWDWISINQITAPLYWERDGDNYSQFTLAGLQPLNNAEPVCHVSFFEADAFARWHGARLPSEEEWEHHVTSAKLNCADKNFMETGLLHPQAAQMDTTSSGQQFFGDLWEWTVSAYSPYPGYKTLEGALGEYNGKFMNNQRVLRGGSCITPGKHIRASYRNYFQPDKRWQFCGIRLAFDG